MQIVIDNIEQFKIFFDVIYDMSSDLVELQFYPDRLVCAVLDRSKTRFFHVEYDDEFFDEYIIDEVNSVVVFVEDLHNLLKSTNRTDVLYLDINDPTMVCKIESDNGNSRVFEFVLPTEMVTSPSAPHIDLPAIFECNVSDLKQSVKDIGLIGSDLYRLVVSDGQLTVMTSDDIATKYANTIQVDLQNPEDNLVCSSAFTLEYVSQMLKFDKITKDVTLKLGSDMPLFYTFKDELMGVTVNGMIAPRISEE